MVNGSEPSSSVHHSPFTIHHSPFTSFPFIVFLVAGRKRAGRRAFFL
jgi:hypothetical protein